MTSVALTNNSASPLMRSVSLALIFAIVALLAYYVLQANVIASHQYKIKLTSDRLMLAQELNAHLNTEIAGLLSPIKLNSFAAERQMIPAGDIAYLFTNGNVALR